MDARRDEERSARMYARLGRGRATMLADDPTDGADEAPMGLADFYPAKGEAKRAIGPAIWGFLTGALLTGIAWKASK